MTTKILIVSFDYRPRLGGVATCAHEVARALSRHSAAEVRLIAAASESAERDRQFDRHGEFLTRRISLPRTAALAVPKLSAAIAKESISWRPHAIVCMLWMPDGLATWSMLPVRTLTGTPYFVFAHGVETLESRANLKKRLRARLSWVKRLVFQNASGVFAVSSNTANLVERECGVEPSRIKVTNNGVDAQLFTRGSKPHDLVQKYGLEGKTVFLTVSRLHDYKGVDKAIAALSLVRQQRSDFAYLVCGTGPYESELKRQVQKFGLQSHVTFTGPLPFDRLNDYYNLCDVFVLLSRVDPVTPNIEGFGIVFLEAAACGKPSIAGKSGGIPDAVADGETGWVIDPYDERKIADAMLMAIENPELARKTGLKALERATRHFTWARVANEIVSEVKRHERRT